MNPRKLHAYKPCQYFSAVPRGEVPNPEGPLSPIVPHPSGKRWRSAPGAPCGRRRRCQKRTLQDVVGEAREARQVRVRDCEVVAAARHFSRELSKREYGAIFNFNFRGGPLPRKIYPRTIPVSTTSSASAKIPSREKYRLYSVHFNLVPSFLYSNHAHMNMRYACPQTSDGQCCHVLFGDRDCNRCMHARVLHDWYKYTCLSHLTIIRNYVVFLSSFVV